MPRRGIVAAGLTAAALVTLITVFPWESDAPSAGTASHQRRSGNEEAVGAGSAAGRHSAESREKKGGGVKSAGADADPLPGGGQRLSEDVCMLAEVAGGHARPAAACRVPSSGGVVDIRLDFNLAASCGIDLDAQIVGLKSLHHGVYLVRNAGGGKYVIKPECRPAAKWHGQQGWPEAVAHAFSKALLGGRSTAPCAVGAAVFLPEEFRAVVHSDGCGLDMAGVVARGPHSPHTLTGIALGFTTHDENVLEEALRKPQVFSLFSPGKTQKVPQQRREFVGDVSDVLLIDYILLNPDREDKNWFYDAVRKPRSGRVILMDNGWGFAGGGYTESVCAAPRKALICPPMLRHVSKTSNCQGGALENCLFREETVDRMRALLSVWDTLAPVWVEGLSSDPLIAALHHSHNAWEPKAPKHRAPPKGLYSTTLARFFHDCPQAPTSSKEVPTLAQLLKWVLHGMKMRLEKMSLQVSACVADHGREYVFQVSGR